MNHLTWLRRIVSPVLHPFLFAFWPILALYAHNAGEIRPVFMVRPMLVVLPITALLILVSRLISRTMYAAAAMTTLALVAFFGLWPIIGWKFFEEILKPALDIRLSVIFAVYTLFIAAVMAFLARTRKNLEALTYFLNITGVVLIVIPLVQASFYGNWSAKTVMPENLPPGIEIKEDLPTPLPDIYFIVLDAYGREDVLRELYGHDNSGFLQEMRERGFQVANNSRACYSMTTHSLASCLNMGHIVGLFPGGDTNRTGTFELEFRTRNNIVHSVLRDIGYRICVFPSGWYTTEPCPEEKVHIPGTGSLLEPNLFETMLLDSTPIMRLLKKIMPASHEQWYNRILQTFLYLPKVKALYPGQPLFVQAHIIAPHYPIVFNADGTIRALNERFSLGAPNEDMATPEEMEESCRMYIEQLQAVNNLVLNTVDRIVDNSSAPPIILIVSDHGPHRLFSRMKTKDPTALWERFSNLTLAKFPPDYEIIIPDDLHLVNLFPVALKNIIKAPLSENSCWLYPVDTKFLFDLSRIDPVLLDGPKT